MGGTSYSYSARTTRATAKGYTDMSKGVEAVFRQQKERRVHESMRPHGVKLRESRDSAVHPRAVPIILGLDMTGSMRQIPRQLIADGLPTLVSNLMQHGVPGPTICFVGFGDHECDRAPLQFGQFEAGDEELDMWLERTYIEGGGGGNAGESYHLVPLFAAGICETDEWDKRREKGFVFTIGDEPCLRSMPKSALVEIFGADVASQILDKIGYSQNTSVTLEQIRDVVQERWHWFHINVREGSNGSSAETGWTDLLGQRALHVDSHTEIPNLVAETVHAHCNLKLTVADEISEEMTSDEDDNSVEDEEEGTPAAPSPGVSMM